MMEFIKSPAQFTQAVKKSLSASVADIVSSPEFKKCAVVEGMVDKDDMADPDLDYSEQIPAINKTQRSEDPGANDTEDRTPTDRPAAARDADKTDIRDYESYDELDEDVRKDLQDAIKNDEVVELEFEDGDFFDIDPATAKLILKKAKMSDFNKAGKNKEEFLKFLKRTLG